MKTILFIIFLSISYLSLNAQTNYNSGDQELDNDLNSINADAKLDLGSFKTNLRLSYSVSEKKIDYMSVGLKMQPAEIYFALEIGKYSKRSIDEVLVVYQKEKSKGWGYIAKQMGIKPGSEAFHALKNNASGKAKKNKGNHGNKGNKGNKNNNGKKK